MDVLLGPRKSMLAMLMFSLVGRMAHEVGLRHRDSKPADDEDSNEHPLDDVIDDVAAAACK